MGVTGLWRLIDPAGKPVPVETLENKVLAVDISIWLHQMVKGYQDAKGAPLPNAHLMGLFQRLCKLLYFRIKPVFVFDGGFPDLKKETIAKRQDNKTKYNSESERIKRELAIILSKKTAIGSLLGKQISPKKGKSTTEAIDNDDMFKLPALPEKEETESESEEETSSGSTLDLHTVDLESDKFKKLPTKEKYDLLVELQETRKMNSWGRIHELPKESNNFSSFQMQRLLKRRKLQEVIEETEKEMGGCGMSFNELESLLNEEGIDTNIQSYPSRRIASNNTTRYLLINNVKQALADAKKKQETENNSNPTKPSEGSSSIKKDELEDDIEKAIKMSLEPVNETDISACTSKTDDSWTSILTDSDYSDSEDVDDDNVDNFEPPSMSSAKAYIMQYTDFTNKAINKLICSKSRNKKSKIPNVSNILEELNQEKSVIVDTMEIHSSEDNDNEESCNSDSKIKDTSDNLNSSLDSDKMSNEISLEIKKEIDSIDEDYDDADEELQKAIKMSLECIADNNEPMPISKVNISDNESLYCDAMQASVVCVEQPVQTITLDDTNISQCFLGKNVQDKDNLDSTKSDSSDDDFEEVPEVVNTVSKPVVQLTLNVKDKLEDDIFADVFAKKAIVKAVVDDSKNNSLSKLRTDENNSEKTLTNKLKIKQIENEAKIPQEIKTIPDSENKQDLCDRDIEKSKSPNQTINIGKQSKVNDSKLLEPLSTEKLNSMAEEIQVEEQDLLQEKGRLDRIGRNITEQMTKEVQELLQLFGIPYVVAPMEAEAQCAFLESVKLTDGTITDDSDIWLFGGKTVYKNFFNQKKHVLQFLAERIEGSFNLTREQLILLALLVGSDYTTGVAGVGPVTAMEILASFPFNKKQLVNETSNQARYIKLLNGLNEFKQWVRAGKRTDNISLKKKLKNIGLADDFPSVRVVQAYLEPNVEKSEEKFTWGEIDITLLRDYTKAKFGWSQNKLDEIIKPVIKRILDRKSQRTMQDYFKRKIEFQSLQDQMSKRVKAAVQRMDLNAAASENKETDGTKNRKRKIKKKNPEIKDDDSSECDNIKQKAGPSKVKQARSAEGEALKKLNVRAVKLKADPKPIADSFIKKTDRFQEIIPQREKDKHNLLQTRMKAIEMFRKTNIDKKRKNVKRRPNLPKEKADLSESDSD